MSRIFYKKIFELGKDYVFRGSWILFHWIWLAGVDILKVKPCPAATSRIYFVFDLVALTRKQRSCFLILAVLSWMLT